jgi:hypothetical protein
MSDRLKTVENESNTEAAGGGFFVGRKMDATD